MPKANMLVQDSPSTRSSRSRAFGNAVACVSTAQDQSEDRLVARAVFELAEHVTGLNTEAHNDSNMFTSFLETNLSDAATAASSNYEKLLVRAFSQKFSMTSQNFSHKLPNQAPCHRRPAKRSNRPCQHRLRNLSVTSLFVRANTYTSRPPDASRFSVIKNNPTDQTAGLLLSRRTRCPTPQSRQDTSNGISQDGHPTSSYLPHDYEHKVGLSLHQPFENRRDS